jgi:hypothetical protein
VLSREAANELEQLLGNSKGETPAEPEYAAEESTSNTEEAA